MVEAVKRPQNGVPKKPMLFFKLFCYIHPENVLIDSIEASFMFEQVCIRVYMSVCQLQECVCVCVYVHVCMYVCTYVCR